MATPNPLHIGLPAKTAGNKLLGHGGGPSALANALNGIFHVVLQYTHSNMTPSSDLGMLFSSYMKRTFHVHLNEQDALSQLESGPKIVWGLTRLQTFLP